MYGLFDFLKKNISWENWWGRFHISLSCTTEKLNLKIVLPLLPTFLLHQCRYEKNSFQTFRYFSKRILAEYFRKFSNFFKTKFEIKIYQLSAFNSSDPTCFLWCLNFVQFYKYPLQIRHIAVICERKYIYLWRLRFVSKSQTHFSFKNIFLELWFQIC